MLPVIMIRMGCPINHQADNDLSIDTAILRIPNLPQAIFFLSLKIEGRDVIKEEADPCRCETVSEHLPAIYAR